MKYPSKPKLKKIDLKLSKTKGTTMLKSNASLVQRFRWDLCQCLVQYMVENDISQVAFAKLLDIDQARVSEIVNHRIDKVSTDKLIQYNEEINPKVKFKIAQ